MARTEVVKGLWEYIRGKNIWTRICSSTADMS
jgi:chromatin remodeling complex protein RSC6